MATSFRCELCSNENHPDNIPFHLDLEHLHGATTFHTHDFVDGTNQLQALHRSKNRARVALIQDLLLGVHECITISDHTGFWLERNAKFCVEFANVLFEAALDPSTYIFDGGLSEIYLQNVFAGLSICAYGLAAISHTPYLLKLNANSISEKGDLLFSFIWSHKQWISEGKGLGTQSLSKTPWSFADYVLRFACGIRHFMHVDSNMKPDFLTVQSRYYHILLYCWIKNQDRALDIDVTTILFGIGMYLSNDDPQNSKDLLRTLVVAVINTPDLADALTSKVSNMLADETFSIRTLHNLLNISTTMFMGIPRFLNPPSDEDLERLMRNWCAALERSICSGDLASKERNTLDQYTQEELILLSGWGIISEIFEQLCSNRVPLENLSDRAYRRIWLAFMATISSKIVPLMAYTIQHHIVAMPPADCALTCNWLVNPILCVEKFLKRSPTSAPKAALAQREALKASIRAVWWPTFEPLRDMCEPETITQQNPFARGVCASWGHLGLACNFNPLDPRIKYPEPIPRPPVDKSRPGWWKNQGCAYEKCLCRNDPQHRMKVCTGCSKVVYCGARCQTLDWKEGGHKKVCSRRPR